MTDEQKQKIDMMSREQLCRHWRNAPIGDPLLMNDTGDYFAKRLKELGGFSVEISKMIGWEGD